MFVGGVRSSKLSALLAGTIIFIIVFAGLAWNQMDSIELPNRYVPPRSHRTDRIVFPARRPRG